MILARNAREIWPMVQFVPEEEHHNCRTSEFRKPANRQELGNKTKYRAESVRWRCYDISLPDASNLRLPKSSNRSTNSRRPNG
jgi:hypothetical protein